MLSQLNVRVLFVDFTIFFFKRRNLLWTGFPHILHVWFYIYEHLRNEMIFDDSKTTHHTNLLVNDI